MIKTINHLMIIWIHHSNASVMMSPGRNLDNLLLKECFWNLLTSLEVNLFTLSVLICTHIRMQERLERPDNQSPDNLVVITTRVAFLMNEEDSYKGVNIIRDLNNIGIKSVSELYLYLEPRKSLVRINEALAKVGGQPITMNLMNYFISGSLYMNMR